MKAPRWTASELARLTYYWERGATRATLEIALAPHPWSEILRQSWRLGLPRLPLGWVSIAEAARRAGYDHKVFAEMLSAWPVRIRPHPRPSTPKPGARPSRIVCWARVERCVRAYLANVGELSTEAGARLGVRPFKLRSWAYCDGEIERGPKAHHRLAPAVWDRIVARRRGETPAAAARRLGVPVSTLRNWLRAENTNARRAGPRRVERHPPETYNRLAAGRRAGIERAA